MFSIISPGWLLWLMLYPAVFPARQADTKPAASGNAAQASPQADPQANPQASLLLTERSSPSDLAVGGELRGLPPGTMRYVRYEDLLELPQESYTISDDSNFKGATTISGVPLATLAKLFGQSAHSNVIIAICYDKYRSNYPTEYLAEHHPILVLKINGKLRDQWPLSEDGGPLGPYLVSHPTFKPSFKILSHEDEAQIPFGVIRLDFRNQADVYAPILPAGPDANDATVRQGYEIARQDCFRCHGMRSEGGDRASRSWLILAAWAATDPTRFEQYVRKPQAIQPCARMPAHSGYDDATLAALTRYFSGFMQAGATQ